MAQQTSPGRSIMADGRIVWVSGKTLFEGRKKTDMQTKQPVLDKTTGQQVIEYGFGLAIPKHMIGQPQPHTGGPSIWQEIHAEAMTMFPNGGQIPPSFAMKYKDGDTIDERGQPYANREGYAGCIVFACTTRIPIKFFKNEGQGNMQVSEGIKCGDYVRVQISCKAHPALGLGKAGLYMNPNAVQFMAWGAEIINTPSGDDIFGTVAPPIPPGGSATPIAPAGAFPGQPPVGTFPPPMAAQPQYQQPLPPAAHHAVLPPQFQPPAGGVPMSGYPPPPAAPPQGYAPPAGQFQPPTMPPTAPPTYPTNVPGYPPPPR